MTLTQKYQDKIRRSRKDTETSLSAFRSLVTDLFGQAINIKDLTEEQAEKICDEMEGVVVLDPEVEPEPEPEPKSSPEPEPEPESEEARTERYVRIKTAIQRPRLLIILSHPYCLVRMSEFMKKIYDDNIFMCHIKLNFTTAESAYEVHPKIMDMIVEIQDRCKAINSRSMGREYNLVLGDINSVIEMVKVPNAKRRFAIQLEERFDPTRAVRDRRFIDRYFVWDKPQKAALRTHEVPVEKIRIIGSLWHTSLSYTRQRFWQDKVKRTWRVVLIPPANSTPPRAFWGGTGILKAIKAMNMKPELFLQSARGPSWKPPELARIYSEFIPDDNPERLDFPNFVVLHHGETNHIMAAFEVPALHVKPDMHIKPSDFDMAKPEVMDNRYIHGNIQKVLIEEMDPYAKPQGNVL